jgi:hypothetical protein
LLTPEIVVVMFRQAERLQRDLEREARLTANGVI